MRCVFDNKYYLALPTGTCSSASNKTKSACSAAGGTWTGATVNNKVFVFDLLTSQWTSVNDYPAMSGSLAFHVDDWVICSHGSNPTRRRLFACNDTGWYLMHENATDDSNRKIGSSSESNTTAISAKLKTRDYLFGEQGHQEFQARSIGSKLRIFGCIHHKAQHHRSRFHHHGIKLHGRKHGRSFITIQRWQKKRLFGQHRIRRDGG